MKLIVTIAILVIGADTAPQGYNLLTPSAPSSFTRRCSAGQVLHIDGRCVTPRVKHRVFLFNAPPAPVVHRPPPYVPEPVIERKHLFIQTPEAGYGPEPLIVPPPTQQNIIYVLNKHSEENQKVIEVSTPPALNPEVYFISYAEGENPSLPGEVDLQTALRAASPGNTQVVGLNDNFAFTEEFGIGGGFRGKADMGIQSVAGHLAFGSNTDVESDEHFLSNNGFISNLGNGGAVISTFEPANNFRFASSFGGRENVRTESASFSDESIPDSAKNDIFLDSNSFNANTINNNQNFATHDFSNDAESIDLGNDLGFISVSNPKGISFGRGGVSGSNADFDSIEGKYFSTGGRTHINSVHDLLSTSSAAIVSALSNLFITP